VIFEYKCTQTCSKEHSTYHIKNQCNWLNTSMTIGACQLPAAAGSVRHPHEDNAVRSQASQALEELENWKMPLHTYTVFTHTHMCNTLHIKWPHIMYYSYSPKNINWKNWSTQRVKTDASTRPSNLFLASSDLDLWPVSSQLLRHNAHLL